VFQRIMPFRGGKDGGCVLGSGPGGGLAIEFGEDLFLIEMVRESIDIGDVGFADLDAGESDDNAIGSCGCEPCGRAGEILIAREKSFAGLLGEITSREDGGLASRTTQSWGVRISGIMEIRQAVVPGATFTGSSKPWRK